MTEAQARYLAKFFGLQAARQAAGAAGLTDADESEWIALLDDLWWKLTAEEQDEIDQAFAAQGHAVVNRPPPERN